MKFLVTGGAGFIGSHLVENLVHEGHIIIVADDLSTGCLKNLTENENIQIIHDKIQDLEKSQFHDFDGIYHLAAQASVPVSIGNLYSSSVNNLNSSIYVFEIARMYNIPVVYASSSAIYGNLPVGDEEKDEFDILSPYALDKLTIENYAKLCFQIYKVSSLGLRFFNVYGPKQDPKNPYSGVISVFIDNFLQKNEIQINGGYQTRDFIFVTDIVKVLKFSMEKLQSIKMCNAFNVGTGIETSVDELYEKLAKIFKFRPEIIRKTLPLGDPARSSGSFQKLIREFQLDLNNFIGIEKGLIETVNYFKNLYLG